MRKRSRRIFRTILALAIASAVAFAINLPIRSVDASTSQAAKAHELVNEARAGSGLGRLTNNSRLVQLAQAQANRMRDSGKIFHNPNLAAEVSNSGPGWRKYGENVGVGPDVYDIHAAFMASSAHRHNIMDPEFNALGVAVAASDDGRIYVAQVFGTGQTQAPPAPAAPAAKRAAGRTHLLAEDGTSVPCSFYGKSSPC